MEERHERGKAEALKTDRTTSETNKTEEAPGPIGEDSQPEPYFRLTSAELKDAINRFDEWFRYAETIGQQRLHSFLQTSAILLAVCAAFLSKPDGAWYSLPFFCNWRSSFVIVDIPRIASSEIS
jgi:hypothetical protein